MTFLVGVELGFSASGALRIIDTFTNLKKIEGIEIKLNVIKMKNFLSYKSFQTQLFKLQVFRKFFAMKIPYTKTMKMILKRLANN